MTTRNVLGFVIVLIAAAGSVYLARSLTSVDAPPLTGDTPRRGFYLKSARILGTDENGKQLYEIEAEFAEQQANNEIEFQKKHDSALHKSLKKNNNRDWKIIDPPQ